ncbi:MAG TPA: ferritin-like domain-containing protein [Haliangiales bacterium]|nr:ferritin-like domain-containing protein [Haliangiales bacterium]
MRPVHRWVWRDAGRRARKLLTFARTEADGGRDIARAAELTRDGILRRLYLRHARDEQSHADLFAARGRAILAELGGARSGIELAWLSPGERGLDELRVEEHGDASLLAFLHLSEKAAAGRFAVYRDVLADRATADVFARVLHDEEFHMTYTRTQLARVAPRGSALWRARGERVWKSYLRIASGVAGLLGWAMLLVQYFIIIPVFAIFAKRSARREREGFVPRADRSLESQY